MRRLRLPALLAALATLPVLALPAMEASAGSDAGSEAAAQYKKGATSYRKRCARCHGVNMINPGPGIFDLRTFPKDDKPRFVNVVINGKNAMPSWGDVLQSDGIDALWVYVTQ